MLIFKFSATGKNCRTNILGKKLFFTKKICSIFSCFIFHEKLKPNSETPTRTLREPPRSELELQRERNSLQNRTNVAGNDAGSKKTASQSRSLKRTICRKKN